MNNRSFDLVLLSNWEDQIIYEAKMELDEPAGPASKTLVPSAHTSLTNPVNKALESGEWTQSIIWGPKAPFR